MSSFNWQCLPNFPYYWGQLLRFPYRLGAIVTFDLFEYHLGVIHRHLGVIWAILAPLGATGMFAPSVLQDNPRESIKWHYENLVEVMNIVIVLITFFFVFDVYLSYIFFWCLSFLKNYLCSFWSRVLKMVILGPLPDLSWFR